MNQKNLPQTQTSIALSKAFQKRTPCFCLLSFPAFYFPKKTNTKKSLESFLRIDSSDLSFGMKQHPFGAAQLRFTLL